MRAVAKPPAPLSDSTEFDARATRGRMHLNWFSLAFSGPHAELEKPFREKYYLRSVPHLRIAMPLGALFYGIFAILDQLLMPRQKHIAWAIRFAVVCPATLAVIPLTTRRWFKTLMQPLLAALILLGGIGIIAMIVLAPAPVGHSYYAGLILVLLFSYTLIRARFVWATATGWSLVLLYEFAALLLIRTPGPVLLGNSFFLVGANLAGMVTCYAMEYATRRDFFLVQLLSREREKVAFANSLLESKVEERTGELRRTNRQLQQEIADRHRAEQERLRLQQQLKQAEKLEAIGKLAAGVAHDLNNILTGLVTYPEYLMLQFPADGRLHDAMQTIRQSGVKAAAIVQDMLSLTRQGVMDKKAVQLNAVVGEYLRSPEFVRLQSACPHVHLDVDLQADLLNVMGSSVHLTKALMNLVNNAFEANLVPGAVRIGTRNRYVDKPLEAYERIGEGEYAVLSVADTGIGIDADDVRKIFEPFYTRKKMGRSGTGLGMTLIWATVKDHGGFIDIVSAEGRGSNFELYFPVTRQAVAERDALPTLEDCRGTESVLVVDDVPEQREIAAAMLQKLGYRVLTAASGEAAIDCLKTEAADILILDMMMDPGIDGCETYRRIVRDRPRQKAIIASGFSESERVREAQRLGAGGYVRKPYTLERIARALRAELDRRPNPADEPG